MAAAMRDDAEVSESSDSTVAADACETVDVAEAADPLLLKRRRILRPKSATPVPVSSSASKAGSRNFLILFKCFDAIM
jgi:hypothetical protein